jgi:hypothetical protein
VIGRHYSEFILPQEVEKSRFVFNERRTGSRAASGLELRLRRGLSPMEPPDFPVEIKAQGIYDRESERQDKNYLGTYGVARDLRERKALEHHLQQVEKMEAVGRLAGGIAHDFNNFLAAVMGNIALAKMHTKPSEEIHSRLQQMEKATLRARDLTQQLITFAQGGLPMKRAGRLAELIQKRPPRAAGPGARCRCSFRKTSDREFDSGQITRCPEPDHQRRPGHAGGRPDRRAGRTSQSPKATPALKPGYMWVTVRTRPEGIPP